MAERDAPDSEEPTGPGRPDEDNPYVRDPETEFRPIGELSESEAEAQAAALRDAIRFHDFRYYVENDPVIADGAYDRLFERLLDLEDAFDLETEDSPTQRVGGEPVDELGEVEHVVPMLSIDSGGEPEDVRDFAERVEREVGDDVRYVCAPKFDGLSVEVVYVDGVYRRAATRGDGETGEDVTENVRTIRSVPLRLRGDPPGFLAVRGEVYMPRTAFHEYNRERVERGDDPFANPRNAAAGTLRQLDPSKSAERPLDCFFYDVLAAGSDEAISESTDEALAAGSDGALSSGTDDIDAGGAVADAATASSGAIDVTGLDTHWAEHEHLPAWGLKVDERTTRVDDIEDAITYRDELLAEREELDYEIDGVVIKVDDRERCEALGTTARAYRWAFAYKFPPRTETTRITDVVVQVGRTGRLTPVALLDPVEVSGVTISRASLHNQAEVESMGVDVGDEVRIERAGDVIPYVDEVVESHSKGHFELPDTCPVCGSPVERDGPLTFCLGGLSCPAQLKGAIEHFTGDDGLDVEGIGEEAADTFVEEGLVETDLADLFDITVADLTTLEGWGQKSARQVVDRLENATSPPLADFLSAIGIPEVGPTMARNLARHFGTLDAVMAADEDELREVTAVGPVVAGHIRGFFESERNRAVIERLRERGVEPRAVEDAGEGSDALADLTVVFTGSVEGWTRDDLEAIVERNGGSATGSVSGNTDYLVVGANPGRSKREDADENDVPTLDPDAFFDLLADRGVDVSEPP